MLTALLVTLWVTICGTFLTYTWDRDAPLPVRLAGGTILGLTVWGYVGYVAASLLAPHGMSAGAQIASAIPLALGFLPTISPSRRVLIRRDFRRFRRALRPRFNSRARWTVRAGVAVALLILIPCLRGALYVRDGGWWTTNPFNHGDVSWHLAIIEGFAHGANFPPQHPEFAGARLTYPFLVDFTTAQYEVLGAPVPDAFLLQNLTLTFAFVLLGLRWAIAVTRRPLAVAVAPALWMLSGGWGFYQFFADARVSTQAGQTLGAFLMNLPRDYTRDLAGDWSWGNMMTCLVITQRGLFQAFPLAFLVLTLLWQAFRAPHADVHTSNRTRLIWAGAITGLMPLVHGHTFLSLIIVAGGLALLEWHRRGLRHLPAVASVWLPFFLAAALLTLPQAQVLAQGSDIDKARFFGFQPGWDCKPTENWIVFWVRNTGLLLPLLGFAYLMRTRRGGKIIGPRLRAYYLPFLLCFVVPNLFRLAPWVWDNIKVLVYWFLASCLIVGRSLSEMARRTRAGAVCAAVCLVGLTLAGGLDVWKAGSGQRAAPVFSRDELDFAAFARQVMPPGSIVLHAPRYNHPVLLAGRHVVSGYEGHLYSHGLKYTERQAEVRRIYAGAADANDLIHRLKIGYIVVGPAERNDNTLVINDAFLARFPLIGEAGGYRLYRAVP